MYKFHIALILSAALLASCEELPDDELNGSSSSSTTSSSTTTTTTTGSSSSSDSSSSSKWTWDDGKGFSATNAKRDGSVTLTLRSVNSHGINYAHTSYNHWAGANSIAALVYPDGTRRKFEWAPNSRTSRSWENVNAGYGGMPKPTSGSSMGFQLFSTDGKHCSNTLSFKWP